MSPKLLQVVRTVATVLLIWLALRWLARAHSWLVLLPMLITGSNVCTVWIVRYQPALAAKLSRKPGVGAYVRLVCRLAALQVPSGARTDLNAQQWLCVCERDYHLATRQLRQSVRGHDRAIEQIILAIKTAVELRRFRTRSAGSPIASFLLQGSQGIGKVFLAQQLTRQMYRGAAFLHFDFTSETFQSVFGGAGSEGRLLSAIRQNPFQFICVEHVENASPELQEAFQTILNSGTYQRPDQPNAVSFEQTIVCFTTTAGSQANSTGNLTAKPVDSGDGQSIVDLLVQEAGLSPHLLRRLTLMLPLQDPDPYTQSEVIAQQMHYEVSAHGFELVHVDPLLITSELLRLSGEAGFSHVQSNIKRLLATALLEATRSRAKSLSLYVH